jgi:hypothetical protein
LGTEIRICEKYSCFKVLGVFGGIRLSFRNHNRVAARVFSVGYDYSFTGLSRDFL